MNRAQIALVACIALAGCSAPTEASKQTAAPEAATSTADTGPSPDPVVTPTNLPPAAPEASSPPPEEPEVAKVGPTQWFTYENGLKVQVTKLARFKIGPYAAGGNPGGTGVIVTVTIRNGTKQTFDANSVTISLATGPNGDAADTVYDSDKGLTGGFEGSIPPGRAKTTKAGFAAPAAHMGQLIVEVTPGFLDYESCFFEGAATSF